MKVAGGRLHKGRLALIVAGEEVVGSASSF